MTTNPDNAPAPKRRRLWHIYLIAAVGVLAGVLGREPLLDFLTPSTPVNPTTVGLSSERVEAVRRQAQERIGPNLDWADAESERLIEVHLREISDFFDQAKKGTHSFAAEALSYSSKWRLTADYMPFTKGERHEQYIRSSFERHVFRADDLAKVIEQSISAYVAELHDIENQMLVSMRADLADLPPAALPNFSDHEILSQAFSDAIKLTAKKSRKDLRTETEVDAATLIAGEVLALVALRLGVSAGILSTGAGSSWATFGVGLVIGVIVDQMVFLVWDWWADPKGELAVKINNQLDLMHQLINQGDRETQGLHDRLAEVAHQRKRVRREAVSSMLAMENP